MVTWTPSGCTLHLLVGLYTTSGSLLSLTAGPAGLVCSLRTYLTYILVPIPEAQQQMGQHVHHVWLKELPQHSAEHLEGKEGSWGRRWTAGTTSLQPPHLLETLRAAVGLTWLPHEAAAPSASPTSTDMAEQKGKEIHP